ncbi:MAG: hypothetical protein ACFB0E_03815 [Leptolyngbyaceae cyanobacterium]
MAGTLAALLSDRLSSLTFDAPVIATKQLLRQQRSTAAKMVSPLKLSTL